MTFISKFKPDPGTAGAGTGDVFSADSGDSVINDSQTQALIGRFSGAFPKFAYMNVYDIHNPVSGPPYDEINGEVVGIRWTMKLFDTAVVNSGFGVWRAALMGKVFSNSWSIPSTRFSEAFWGFRRTLPYPTDINDVLQPNTRWQDSWFSTVTSSWAFFPSLWQTGTEISFWEGTLAPAGDQRYESTDAISLFNSYIANQPYADFPAVGVVVDTYLLPNAAEYFRPFLSGSEPTETGMTMELEWYVRGAQPVVSDAFAGERVRARSLAGNRVQADTDARERVFATGHSRERVEADTLSGERVRANYSAVNTGETK